MKDGQYIQFVEDTPKPKTNVWEVVTRPGGVVIGVIQWYSPWRKYGFFPRDDTVYEQVCLREIAQFCENETASRKRQRELKKATA
jgi:hypothetical protein